MRIFYGVAIAAAFGIGAIIGRNVTGIGPLEWFLMALAFGAGIPQLTRFRVTTRD